MFTLILLAPNKLTSRDPWIQVVPRRSSCLQVVDHYERPRNVGSFEKADENVGTGLVGAPACGDVMRLQIKVDESGNITDSCFKTFGCGSAIASSSVATEWVKGKSIDEVLTIKNRDIAKHLSLPPVKLHCSMLAEDAIKAAVKDIQVSLPSGQLPNAVWIYAAVGHIDLKIELSCLLSTCSLCHAGEACQGAEASDCLNLP